MVADTALEHIVTRVTDEGLVIELFDLPGALLFDPRTETPTDLLRDLAQLIQNVAKATANMVAVEGHVAAQPIVIARSEVWDMSSNRAHQMRLLLGESGMPTARISRVTGHADREPVLEDPMSLRNNRLEVILLRDVK